MALDGKRCVILSEKDVSLCFQLFRGWIPTKIPGHDIPAAGLSLERRLYLEQHGLMELYKSFESITMGWRAEDIS